MADFMQPQIMHSSYFKVETTEGTEIVPDFVFSAPKNKESASAEMLGPYCQGQIKDRKALYMSCGPDYLARLSAPGFLDSTEWTAFKSLEEAQTFLDELGRNEDA